MKNKLLIMNLLHAQLALSIRTASSAAQHTSTSSSMESRSETKEEQGEAGGAVASQEDCQNGSCRLGIQNPPESPGDATRMIALDEQSICLASLAEETHAHVLLGAFSTLLQRQADGLSKLILPSDIDAASCPETAEGSRVYLVCKGYFLHVIF
jgi:hypothetical protein